MEPLPLDTVGTISSGIRLLAHQLRPPVGQIIGCQKDERIVRNQRKMLVSNYLYWKIKETKQPGNPIKQARK
jgi:hypothetical protein